MRAIWAVVGCLALAGCKPAEIKQCEDFIVTKLKAPSTFHVVSTQSVDFGGKRHVEVDYDANNAFNAPIRDKQFCSFPLTKTGAADTTNYIDFDEQTSDDFQNDLDSENATRGITR